MSQQRCECPSEATGAMPISWYQEEEMSGRIHAPNQCAGTFQLAQYQRGKDILWLCSCCNLSRDIRIP